jgi:hypothetical protein
MNLVSIIAWLIVGAIIGWLIEWVIDWLFWRSDNTQLRVELSECRAEKRDLLAQLAEGHKPHEALATAHAEIADLKAQLADAQKIGARHTQGDGGEAE